MFKPLHCIEADAIPPTPWRNGGGRTRELFAWPPGPDWRLRISLADIEADGPFSAFPGVQRHFAVLEGAGVELDFDGQRQRLAMQDAPCVFDGAAAPGCRLLDGPTRDLNLMLRGLRGTLVRADGPAPEDWPWRALFCSGAARLHGAAARPLVLAARSLLIGLPAGPLQVQPLDAAPVFWIGAAQEVGRGGVKRLARQVHHHQRTGV